MTRESDEQNPQKKRLPQSSYSRALEQISNKETLTKIEEKAQKTIGKTEVYICESTRKDDANKLFFVVDTLDEDEEKLTNLGRKLEKLHGHTDWMVVRKQSETPQQFNRTYQNLTLLSSKNSQQVQVFAENTDSQSKKIRQ